MLFLHGTQDEHGDVAKLEKLIPQVRNAESVIITGADHFFTKQLDAVEETMRSWAVEIFGSLEPRQQQPDIIRRFPRAKRPATRR